MAMPAYGAQSAHNKKTHDFLATEAPEYSDWQITTLFYSALHSFNRHFELEGVEIPDRHGKRLALINRKLPSIREAYKNLQMLSEQSRYGGRDEADDSAVKSALKSYREIMDRLELDERAYSSER